MKQPEEKPRVNLKKESDSDEPEKKSLREFLEWEAPNRKPPPLGMRAIKTIVVTGILLIVYQLLGRQGVLLALSAGVIAMQSSIGSSIHMGIVRICGTGLGGLVAILLMFIVFLNPYKETAVIFNDVMVCVGTALIIYICIWFNIRDAIVISLVVFFFIMIDDTFDNVQEMVMYALTRMLDTAIGIIAAVVVNVTIQPPKDKEKKKEEREENRKERKK